MLSGFTLFFKQASGSLRQPGAGVSLPRGIVKTNLPSALSDTQLQQPQQAYKYKRTPCLHACNVQGRVDIRFAYLPHPYSTLAFHAFFLVTSHIHQVPHAFVAANPMPRHRTFRPCKLFRDLHNVIAIFAQSRSLGLPTSHPDQRMIWSKAYKTIGTDLLGTMLDRDRRDERDVQGLDRYCDYYVCRRSCTSWMRPVISFQFPPVHTKCPIPFRQTNFPQYWLQLCCKRTHSLHCIGRHSHKSTRHQLAAANRALLLTPYFLSFCPNGSS